MCTNFLLCLGIYTDGHVDGTYRRLELVPEQSPHASVCIIKGLCKAHLKAATMPESLSAAQVCTVFAQLTVNGKWEGPHVFVVRIRDDQGNLNKGVRIRDNGPKMGLNGVDNGQIWFEHVRIPRDALLNRFADVSADGTYSSPFPTVGQRFGVTVGGLTTGGLRMLLRRHGNLCCSWSSSPRSGANCCYNGLKQLL